MAEAVFRTHFAGPLVSYQDSGRRGHLRFGVPASGPMDRLSHAAGNAALGNAKGATAIEVSMGGVVLECTQGSVTLALTGGGFSFDIGPQSLKSGAVATVQAGDRVTIRPGAKGSWCYLAFAGQLQVPQWLGHCATHALSGFGGGMLRAGTSFVVTDARVETAREGQIASFVCDDGHDDTIRVVMGPQDRHFQPQAKTAFLNAPFALTDAYDRMGVRLNGPKLDLKGALSIPSEPILRGAIQVAGDGVPTVLLADHQTTGGYPKIATVLSVDQDRLCQRRAGDKIRFVAVPPAQAVELARKRAAKIETYLTGIAVPRGTLMQRLMRENLISGAVGGDSGE